MPKTLMPRREAVLKIIVKEYITRVTPVASESITRSHLVGVSPATIRNDMAYLEEEGYITRPHVSAGAIPSCKGYRYYAESLGENIELPLMEQYLVQGFLERIEREFEELAKIASALLARLVRSAAIVTTPKANPCRFKHLELVAFQEYLVLLILVMYQAKLRRYLLSTLTSVAEEELATVTNKLNNAYLGLASSEIRAKKLELSPLEREVTDAIINLMAMEDEVEYDEPYLEGLHLMLSQPEFIKGNRILNTIGLLEGGKWLRAVLPRELGETEIKLVIGEENEDELLRDLSLVFTRYGILGEVGGVIGVIGPTRMDYARAISSVRYLSGVLSKLVSEAYG